MTLLRALSTVVLGGLLVTGCGGGSEPNPPPVVDCSAATPTVLAAGEHTIIDAVQNGCVRLPAAGDGGADYLYVALSAQGQEDSSGFTADYSLAGGSPAVAAVEPLSSPLLSAFGPRLSADAFHHLLRSRERALARQPGAALFRQEAVGAAAVPPVVGDQRTFSVCATSDCTSFVQTTATAKVVNPAPGGHVAIFLDNAAPPGGYSQANLDDVGALFDAHLYSIDTTAFGRETDFDNNGRVIVLLTHRVNELSPNCDAENSIILGYFFGLDLFAKFTPGIDPSGNSNEGEIFYGVVPDPNNPNCRVELAEALDQLPWVFIHEFQHMINYGQHVLVRSGNQGEQTWLNEGLSHFAEELGGREVPDAECPDFASCESQFISDNIRDGYLYLEEPEDNFLIFPIPDAGSPAERGANWLFVRWLADHFAATQPLGTELTRALVRTTLVGANNVATVTGVPFETLVSEWQLANYLENLPGFQQTSGRLRYTSWDFRDVYQQNFGVPPFLRPYPLVPDVAQNGDYARNGVLRGGSGRHVRIVQDPNQGPVDFKLTGLNGVSALPDEVLPRIALVRIR